MAQKPDKEFLKRVKKEMQKRFTESKKIVDGRKDDWEVWMNAYLNEVLERQHSHESNLPISKPYYVIETLTPQVLSTIFGMAEWLTIKDPLIPDATLRTQEQWFMWFLMTKLNFYLHVMEISKGSMIKGMGLSKPSLRNGMPTLDYLELEDFYPDPRCKKPATVDSMLWCFFKIRRDFSQLERATIPRIRYVEKQVPMNISPQEAEMMMAQGMPPFEMKQVPEVYMDQLYFNLDEVWSKHVKKDAKQVKSVIKSSTEEQTVDIPELEIVEMVGEIETSLGEYDINRATYKPGRYEEYICAAVLDGDDIDIVIRCEPSEFKYFDIYENKNKYFKPVQACPYSIVPGRFYSMGAIEPIMPYVTELKEHHDLYLDEHKRAVCSILSVRSNSGLTKDELAIRPFNIWKPKRHDDIQVIKFPEVNLNAFRAIHDMLDREADRTIAVPPSEQGMAVSKRQTAREFAGLAAESTRRHSTFIQIMDKLYLRPLAFKMMLMMRQMPHVMEGKPFILPSGPVTIRPEELLEQHEIQFAATGVEPEHSIYQKGEMFPQLINKLASTILQTAQAAGSGSPVTLNIQEIVKEMESLYHFKNAGRFVVPNEQVVPVQALAEVTKGNPELQQIVQNVVQQAHQFMMQQQQQPKSRG